MSSTLAGLFALAARAAAILALAGLTTMSTGAVTSAYADVAASKAVVDQAKAQGIVGEQGDGYLGLVTGTAPDDVKAAVAEINAGRSKVFADTAAKAGTSPAAAGEATAKLILAKMPPGQYYKPLGGAWTKM